MMYLAVNSKGSYLGVENVGAILKGLKILTGKPVQYLYEWEEGIVVYYDEDGSGYPKEGHGVTKHIIQ